MKKNLFILLLLSSCSYKNPEESDYDIIIKEANQMEHPRTDSLLKSVKNLNDAFENAKVISETDKWETIHIKDVGSIKISPSLEIQDGSYKAKNKAMYEAHGIEYTSDDLVFQQRGLNNNKPGSKNTYVRAMISTIRNNPRTYGSIKQKLNLSESDLTDIDNTYQEIAKNALLENTKLIKWIKVKETVLNNMNGLTYAYQRQLSNNPIVEVNTFMFFNNDKVHTLSFSYRIAEKEKWKPILDNMRATFRIRN